MTLKRLVLSQLLALAVAMLCSGSAFAQSVQPTEARLLNGLKLLVFKKADEGKLTVKLRIHSGSAFDPLGKEGTMYLLSQILFPNQELRDFFQEDLGGSLVITSNYDFIQIDATAKSDKLIEMLEPIAAGLTSPQITKETTQRVKAPASQLAMSLESDRGYAATLAASHNLVGNFPYGRPTIGSSASLAKVDFADLMQADERFLTSDNATLVISGNVDSAYALKVVKRLFGGWTKADKKVPATFAQPETPKQVSITQELSSVSEGSTEIRSAVRGFSRKDPLYAANLYLEKIIRGRLAESNPDKVVYVASGSALQSVIVFGLNDASEDPKTAVLSAVLGKDVSEAEFAKAQTLISGGLSGGDIIQRWLDVDTYGVENPEKEIAKIKTVTIVDVQNALNALRKAPAVTTIFTATKKPASDR